MPVRKEPILPNGSKSFKKGANIFPGTQQDSGRRIKVKDTKIKGVRVS